MCYSITLCMPTSPVLVWGVAMGGVNHMTHPLTVKCLSRSVMIVQQLPRGCAVQTTPELDEAQCILNLDQLLAVVFACESAFCDSYLKVKPVCVHGTCTLVSPLAISKETSSPLLPLLIEHCQ